MSRVILIVLDSLGVGGAPDAEQFGDAGANTLGNIIKSCLKGEANKGREGPLKIPNLEALGLISALNLANEVSSARLKNNIRGSFAVATSNSNGKDTPSGHWELMSAPVTFDWHYFKRQIPVFPQDKIRQIIDKTKISGILGNCHSSGTRVINEFGEEHIRTKKPIFYTSADSVVQIAAHEEFFGLSQR